MIYGSQPILYLETKQYNQFCIKQHYVTVKFSNCKRSWYCGKSWYYQRNSHHEEARMDEGYKYAAGSNISSKLLQTNSWQCNDHDCTNNCSSSCQISPGSSFIGWEVAISSPVPIHYVSHLPSVQSIISKSYCLWTKLGHASWTSTFVRISSADVLYLYLICFLFGQSMGTLPRWAHGHFSQGLFHRWQFPSFYHPPSQAMN